MDSPWIFGYGSVIWNQGFPFVESRKVAVQGWTRKFWQGSTDHRGVPGAPGRVVTLVPDPGQECWGLAFRLDPEHWQETLARMDIREQGGYTRLWLVSDGPDCLAYVAREDNPDYLGEAPVAELALQMSTAVGPSGANWDYLFRLADCLRALDIVDPHVFALEQAVRQLRA